nr:tyrosine-type recombinase/integrase [Planomonospora venezuelensis]
MRDRAIIYLLFGTGLRRAELVGLDLDHLEPAAPEQLRQAKKARLVGVRGKGRTSRTVFLGRDARQALADYLEAERPGDAAASAGPAALLLSAASIAARRLGHANDRYLRLYTNPPDDIAADYVEDL